MPEQSASDKTEQPTPERLKKAREEGQVAQSQEVPSALMVLGMLVLMLVISGYLYNWFVSQVRGGLSRTLEGSMTVGTFSDMLRARGFDCFMALVPFLAAAAAVSALSSMLVGGWAFAPQAAKAKLARISPIKGLKNLFSMRSLVKLLVSMAKLAVLLTVTWHYLKGRMGAMLDLQWTTPAGMLCEIARLIGGMVGRIAAALLAIALIDMLYQRWNHKRQLRMTREEVKEERKQHEVSPETKRRVRSLQVAMARKRMLQDVPTADVVVTNPTHFAVALRYEAETMAAPQVVAKGADLLGEQIKKIAAEYAVPIIERPPLARALYDTVEVGETIPETLFVAVAEVLAMIYRLRKKKRTPAGGARK